MRTEAKLTSHLEEFEFNLKKPKEKKRESASLKL